MENRVNEHGNVVDADILNRTKEAIANLKNDIAQLSPADLKNKLPEYEKVFGEFEQATQRAQANQGNSSSNDQGNNTPNDDEPINA